MKKCSGCGEIKELDQFNFKYERRDIRQSRCRICTRIQVKKHFLRNTKYYLEKAKRNSAKDRQVIIAYLREYLSARRCVDCGEKDPVVLEFDHRSGDEKIMPVSLMVGRRLPLSVIADEIAKCGVLCANCHRRKTAKDFGWWKNTAPVA